MNKIFHINEIDDNTISISGKINGIAHRIPWPGELAGSFQFQIHFFVGKVQIKISNGEKDGTVRSAKALEERITRIYNEEFERIMGHSNIDVNTEEK